MSSNDFSEARALTGFNQIAMDAMRHGTDTPLPAPYVRDRWIRMADVVRLHGGFAAEEMLMQAIRHALNMEDTEASAALVKFATLVASEYAFACAESQAETIFAGANHE